MNQEIKVGEKCKECGSIFAETEMIEDKKCETKGKKIIACRCLHPGDFFCCCGKPCYSFF